MTCNVQMFDMVYTVKCGELVCDGFKYGDQNVSMFQCIGSSCRRQAAAVSVEVQAELLIAFNCHC